jgi:hypothetical protein
VEEQEVRCRERKRGVRHLPQLLRKLQLLRPAPLPPALGGPWRRVAE